MSKLSLRLEANFAAMFLMALSSDRSSLQFTLVCTIIGPAVTQNCFSITALQQTATNTQQPTSTTNNDCNRLTVVQIADPEISPHHNTPNKKHNEQTNTTNKQTYAKNRKATNKQAQKIQWNLKILLDIVIIFG